MQDNFSLSFFLILTFTKIIAIDYFIIFDDPLMEWKFLNLTYKDWKMLNWYFEYFVYTNILIQSF